MNITFSADYHTHTVYSHGTGTPEENVLAAISRGLKCIAVTDHGSANVFYGIRERELLPLRREIDALNEKYGDRIRVLMGIECNVTGDGRCDFPVQCRSLFDVVILGYHKGVVPKNAEMRRFLMHALLRTGNCERLRKTLTDYLLHALDEYPISIVSHPGEYVPVDIPRLARGAREHSAALELNAKHPTLTEAELLTIAREGAKIAVSSDAHRPENVGNFDCVLPLCAREEVQGALLNSARNDPEARFFNTIKKQ